MTQLNEYQQQLVDQDVENAGEYGTPYWKPEEGTVPFSGLNVRTYGVGMENWKALEDGFGWYGDISVDWQKVTGKVVTVKVYADDELVGEMMLEKQVRV